MEPAPPPPLESSNEEARRNETCVGPTSKTAGTASSCEGCPNQKECASGKFQKNGEKTEEELAIASRLEKCKSVILVLSGKGGVGKSTMAQAMARELSEGEGNGCKVGLLDIDICGPSVPTMTRKEGADVHRSNGGWQPVYVTENLSVMSIGFLLPNKDDSVVWRGPRKNGLIKQFLCDTEWGELDYLIVDAPPGTSDEHLSIVQYLKGGAKIDGALIVTTPQEVAMADVRKEVNFCEKTGVKVLGVVENMSGSDLRLGEVTFSLDDGKEDVTALVKEALEAKGIDSSRLTIDCPVFAATRGGAEQMCREKGIPFLGKVPIDTGIGRAGEDGDSVFGDASGATGKSKAALRSVIRKLVTNLQ
jgi:Mrp family chromosome partitioning ATPase